MSIWRNAGGDILLSGSVPALVRAWTYRKIWSDCGPLPAWITIVGCDPPACVEYTNTNLDPTGREYLRQTCGEWGGSGSAAYNYAWPDDVPDCPFPDGVTIEAATDCGSLVYLCLAATGDGFNIVSTCYYATLYSQPVVLTGEAGRGGWGTDCWRESHWDYAAVSIDCAGNVNYAAVSGNWPYYHGVGTPIALDAEDLPIGSSVIPVYQNGSPPYWTPGFFGNLTITVSKC